ncbi:MAG: hypothetical protein JST11_08995 [Acidobacteria bacterium]|nr:hypothetical protein [Acidobacteriota bacterium]
MKRRARRDSRAGQATIAITLSLVMMFGMLGLVVDVGWAYWRWEACKTAADAAAFGAAMVARTAPNLTCGSGVTCQTKTACPQAPSNANDTVQVGCMYARSNGFVQGGNSGKQSVYIAAGISNGPVAGTTPGYWVSATVVEQEPQLFSAVLGKQLMTVSARSTANVYVGAGGGCIFVLNKTAAKSYQQISSNLDNGCSLYDDSNASNAVYVESGTLTLDNGANVITAGGVSLPSSTITYNGGGSAKTNQPRNGDPFSGMTAPVPSLPCTPDPQISSGGRTLSPGTYCSISINSADNTTFSPGVYIITNGSLNITSSNNVNANGVTFYFPASSGNVNFTSGTFNLTAPSSGSTAGFAIWKDGPSASSAVLDSSDITINGVIYMPYTNLKYGSSATASRTTIVADTITIDSCHITNAASSPYFTNGGAALGGAFVVE